MLFGLLLACAALHANSLSSSRLAVDGAEVRVELRCQALSLFEVLPDLDADADGLLLASELEAGAQGVFAYVAEHYRILASGEPLPAQPGWSVRLAPPDPRRIFPGPQEVDLEFALLSAEPLADALIEVTLFHTTSPDHREFCQVLWNGAEPAGLVLDRRVPRARLPGDAQPAGWPETMRAVGPESPITRFLVLGFEHILGGWDHLAFLFALLFAARRVASLVGVVTAFTLAHSVTLALASLGVVRVPGSMVEITIALSIAYVGADNLLYPEPRTKWIEAFVFGLIHGLGFAGFLADSLLFAESQAWALVAFNLGVELGQVSVVVLAVLLVRGLQKAFGRGSPTSPEQEGEPEALVARPLRRIGSACVTVLGLWWFVERAWL